MKLTKLLFIGLLGLLPAICRAQKKVVPAAAVMLTGKTIYTQRCMTCHQADGRGAQNMIPPLIKTGQVLGDKAQLIKIVLNGMNGEIKVNDEVYAGEMPAHNDLKDEEIAAVLTYVRNSFGNKASAVKVSEVKLVRAANKK